MVYKITCPITGIQGLLAEIVGLDYFYYIVTGEYSIGISIPIDHANWQENPLITENKVALTGLLLNGKIAPMKEKYTNSTLTPINLEILRKALLENEYPVTPEQKLNNFFVKLFSTQGFDGEPINTSMMDNVTNFMYFKKYYFKTYQEMFFYAKALSETGFLKIRSSEEYSFYSCEITYKGFTHFNKLTSEGTLSRNCFIAMSFGDGMSGIRAAVKEACNLTGYIPILVDEVHHDSDTTINDAIIANLKKSRFCIADFTQQKKGVYFESGFALGQGKQVIYSCRNDSFNESHFDTNHFPHILYDTAEQLRERLINKIEAWIR